MPDWNVEGWSALAVAVATVLPFVWRPIVKGVRAYRAWREQRRVSRAEHAALPGQVAEMARQLAEIGEQFKKNSGKTLSDKVDRIEDRQTKNATALAVHGQRLLAIADTPGEQCWFLAGPDGQYTDTSPGYDSLVGRSNSLGANWVLNIAPNDRSRVTAEWGDAVRSRRIFSMTFEMQREGLPFRVRCDANPNRDADGELIEYFGLVYPATYRDTQ